MTGLTLASSGSVHQRASSGEGPSEKRETASRRLATVEPEPLGQNEPVGHDESKPIACQNVGFQVNC